jgi:hypothetical protein
MPPSNRIGSDPNAINVLKASSEFVKSRTIYSVDLGTTYGTIGVLTIPNTTLPKSIRPEHIVYIDGYYKDRCIYSSPSDVVPTHLYYDSDGIRWGWDVTRCLEQDDHQIHKDPKKYISHFKLLLDETRATQGIRDELKSKVRSLKAAQIVEKEDDFLYHYFTMWLSFARDRAHKSGLDPNIARPEFVICAPSAYSVSSYHRLYKVFDRAARVVWDQHDDKHPPRIFSISEPAAAASYCLAKSTDTVQVSTIRRGMVVICTDFGRSENVFLSSTAAEVLSSSLRTRKSAKATSRSAVQAVCSFYSISEIITD